MESYDNLIEGIKGLKEQGYVEDFNLKENCLECRNNQYQIFHDEFEIDKVFRFEDDSTADDSSILYAISSEKYNLKGIIINSYGMYSETLTDEMLNKLKRHTFN